MITNRRHGHRLRAQQAAGGSPGGSVSDGEAREAPRAIGCPDLYNMAEAINQESSIAPTAVNSGVLQSAAESSSIGRDSIVASQVCRASHGMWHAQLAAGDWVHAAAS